MNSTVARFRAQFRTVVHTTGKIRVVPSRHRTCLHHQPLTDKEPFMSHLPRVHAVVGMRFAASVLVVASALVACSRPPEALVFNPPLETTGGAADTDTPTDLGIDTSTLTDAVTNEIESMTADAIASENTLLSDASTHFAPLMTAWINCFNTPDDCRIAKITAPDSPERTRLTEAAAYYTAEQLRTRPGEGRLEWAIESAQAPSNESLRLVTCEYDTRIFFDVSLADTELGDIIFDSTVWTRRVEWGLRRVDDAWRIESRRIDRRSPVERFCQP